MNKYTLLLKEALCVYKLDGFPALLQETLRYLALYGRPDKIFKCWWIRLFGNPQVIREIQGSKMFLDLRDKGIHTDLFIRDIREPFATAYLQSILQPDWIAVDIGANIGYYALMEARICKRVYALEPEPDNFLLLTKNVKLNGYENVHPLNYAVGDKEKIIKFSLEGISNWHRVALSTTKNKTIDVKMVTLDDFLDGKVDFIRMDIEGYEFNVLRGARETIRRYMPKIFMEIHRDGLKEYGSSAEELLEFLASYNYSLVKSFVLARPSQPGPTGKLVNLLKNKEAKEIITIKSLASHLFFG